MTDRDSRRRGMQFLATAAWFAGMGWVIAIAIVLGVVAGSWLDGRAGKHPLFLLLGMIAGLALGLYSAGRMLLRYLGDAAREGG
jgi:ATP synthase protein I